MKPRSIKTRITLWITLLVVLLPILTLVMGGVIWYRRKNR